MRKIKKFNESIEKKFEVGDRVVSVDGKFKGFLSTIIGIVRNPDDNDEIVLEFDENIGSTSEYNNRFNGRPGHTSWVRYHHIEPYNDYEESDHEEWVEESIEEPEPEKPSGFIKMGFKKGDLLECVDDQYSNDKLKKGNIYVCLEDEKRNNFLHYVVYVEVSIGYRNTRREYFSSRFILHEDIEDQNYEEWDED